MKSTKPRFEMPPRTVQPVNRILAVLKQTQAEIESQRRKQPSVSTRPRGTSDRWEGAKTIPRELVKEMHTLDQSPLRHFAIHVSALSVAGLGSLVAWNAGYPLVTFALWAVAGFLGHAIPLASHDASHGTLHPSKRINELLGLAIGTTIMVPRSVYRYAHAQHHTYIATEKDPELWPFTVTTIPRSLRMLTVAVEIVFGFIYTPLLFVRSVVVADNIPADQMKLIKREYALIAVFWGTIFGTVAATGLWVPFLIGVVGPWAFAGLLQSLNKYVEHMGMMGVGVVGNTRSVVPKDQLGQSLAEAWQNVAYHGTHHLYARIPYYKLPDASQHVIAETPPPGTLYATYTAALFAMLKTLGNPRVGIQWTKADHSK